MIGFHSLPESLSVARELADTHGRFVLSAEFREAREAALSLIAERDALSQLVADHEEVHADRQRLCRELGVILDGEEGAAKQPSLCDLLPPVKKLVESHDALKAQRDRLREALSIGLAISEAGGPFSDIGRAKGGEFASLARAALAATKEAQA